MSPHFVRRFWLSLRRTTPLDRVAVAYLLFYIAERIVHYFGVPLALEIFQGFLTLAVVVYLAIRLVPWVRYRLLWSLRNRVAVVYVFIAVIPILLLLSMVGIAAVLLELQIGAHLLRDDLERHYNIIAADTNAIAAALSREPGLKADTPVPPNSTAVVDPVLSRPGVASVIAAAKAQWPDLRVYVNHGQQLVHSRNGAEFANLAEFRGQLWFAGAESIVIPGGKATVLAVAPITPAVLDSLPSNLGPIELTLLEPSHGRGGVRLDQIVYAPQQEVSSGHRTLGRPAHWFDIRIPGVATLEAVRADTGANVEERPVLAQFDLRASAINGDLLTSVGAIGPTLIDILAIFGLIFLVLEIGAFATGFVLTRTITRSVSDLYEGTLYVRRGDFGHRVRVTKRDQLGALAESFNEMTGSITELIEEQRERQRLEHEVDIAREVQRQLFPQTVPSLPGLEVAAICRPARMVSGDYYDFIELGPTRIGIALADISGKGIFAALLMASLQAALRSASIFDANAGPAEIVGRLNQHLYKNTSDDRYATLFYAVYDSEEKTLTYTNAGHLPPFFISDGCTHSLDQGGTVVGLFEDAPFTQCTLPVKSGSLLVAFSDGLTEPENVYGEEFGMERLKAEVVRQRTVPPARLAENLISGVEQWAGTPEQADDITVVIAHMA